jgi:hydrophobe/amphiphile efflux-1 (HAE1) family protein
LAHRLEQPLHHGAEQFVRLEIEGRPRHQKPDWFTRLLNFVLGWFFRLFNRSLDATTNAYASVVRRLVRVAALVMLLYAGLLYLTYFSFQSVPTGFIPSQDKGYLVANLQMPDAASIERTDEVMRRLAKIANETPGVRNTFAIAGWSVLTGTNQSNMGAMFVVLDDFENRKSPELSASAITGKLMQQYGAVQDGFALVFPPPPVQGLGNAGGFRMQVQDRSGGTPQQLQEATDAVIAAASQDPRLVGLFTGYRANVPQLYANVDRERAKAQDVAVTDVFEALQVYLGSLYVNDFNFLGRTYQVTAQADAAFRASAEDVRQLKTRNRSGQMVPLGSLLYVEDITGPARVNRYNLYPSAEINGAAAPGVSSNDATLLMEQIATKTLPPGMSFEWTELAYQEKLASNTALFIFPLCVLFVFLVHSAEYESWSLPTAIIMIVPMCLLFAIAGVWLRGMDNNIFTQIGFVVLAGLSAKNAVLIVEFAKQQQDEGKNRIDAAVEASRLRLRPILMTSFAFILGVLPLAVAAGAGAEMRQALGTAVFSGMLGVTFFGIFLTPVFYVAIRWLTESHRDVPDRSDSGAEGHAISDHASRQVAIAAHDGNSKELTTGAH